MNNCVCHGSVARVEVEHLSFAGFSWPQVTSSEMNEEKVDRESAENSHGTILIS
jgi:hypothetical protein